MPKYLTTGPVKADRDYAAGETIDLSAADAAELVKLGTLVPASAQKSAAPTAPKKSAATPPDTPAAPAADQSASPADGDAAADPQGKLPD